jgi:hypothetical protein
MLRDAVGRTYAFRNHWDEDTERAMHVLLEAFPTQGVRRSTAQS